jgi:phospholipase C
VRIDLASFSLLLFLAACASHARKAGDCDGPCPESSVNHVVIIIQENHTFDTYFGRYCTAPTGSMPTCTDGPACCEAGPAKEPSGASPVTLDDAQNGAWDPDHTEDCELMEMDSGKMDKYVAGAACSSPNNFAYADPTTIHPYHALAGSYALADRYFQPNAGQSSSNDMFLMTAQFVFKDNSATPDSVGAACGLANSKSTFTVANIGDLLDAAGVSWSFYGEGYDAMAKAYAMSQGCPDPDPACPASLPIYPCIWDGGDYPMEYFAKYRDNPKYIRDYSKFAVDLKNSTLPQVVYVRSLGYKSEHPGVHTTISDGTKFVSEVVAAVQGSAYAADTVVFVAWDEGGGFFDHVSPPGLASDGQPYGTRIPFLAIGPMVRKNTVSHAQLEHSSVVKWIEWNWLHGQTGQLGARDAAVANLGSLFDPALTRVAVPE